MLQPASETFSALISKHMRALKFPKRSRSTHGDLPRQCPGFSIGCGRSRLGESKHCRRRNFRGGRTAFGHLEG